jgi:hypothetical protein
MISSSAPLSSFITPFVIRRGSMTIRQQEELKANSSLAKLRYDEAALARSMKRLDKATKAKLDQQSEGLSSNDDADLQDAIRSFIRVNSDWYDELSAESQDRLIAVITARHRGDLDMRGFRLSIDALKREALG